jgi:hypothetical protein
MSARTEKPRGLYRRGYQPTLAQCERMIFDAWLCLCTEVEVLGDQTIYARIQITRLHDLGIFRARALAAEAALTTTAPAVEEMEVTEYVGNAQILIGNADIANSQRGLPSPDLTACTLPIYPQPGHLPTLHFAGGRA